VTWPDGFTVWIDEDSARSLTHFLQQGFNFRMSRKARLWARRKQER
jgi:hypothetical protein